MDELQARIEDTVARAASARDGFDARVVYDGFTCQGYAVDAESPLVQRLTAAAERVIGRSPDTLASTATTDARAFALHAGTPAVCFGPYAEAIHGIDARVLLPSVLQTAQSLALFIDGWCGLEPG